MAERRKRAGDPPGVDHTEERVTDWRTVAPRWLLVTALVVSFGINGLLGSMLASSVTARLQQIEEKYSDPKWDAIANHAERIGRLETRVEQLREDDIRGQLDSLKDEVRALNARLKRKGF